MRNEEMAKELYNVQKERKCLVLLDDIWTTSTWDRLKAAFPEDDTHSKILLTTRNKNVALHADRNGLLHQPQFLNENESWELFAKKSFFEEDTTNSEDDKRKQELAREMLDHCGGLPLAIAVLGGLISNKQSIQEWEILHKNINTLLRKGKINEQEDSYSGVSWVLGLSYDELPYHLQPCFLYLASFPEDYQIRAKELCRLWMAEGFVSSEEVAYECLSELVERSIVQVEKWGWTGRIKTCHIHDLMRDLCLSKAREENFLQAADLCNQQEGINSSSVGMATNIMPTNKVRRLAIYLNNNSAELLSLVRNKDARLRSLVCVDQQSYYPLWYVGEAVKVKPLLRCFQLLRVLKFEDLRIGELPKEIRDLILLRLFSLKDTYVEKLPSCIGNLRCLQTLDLRVRFSQDINLKQLSRKWKLEQLKHLYLPDHWRKILSFDNLINLQTLVNAFANDHCLRRLEKLASLTKLKVRLDLDLRGVRTRFENLRSLTILSPYIVGNVTTEFSESVKSLIKLATQINKLGLQVTLTKLPEDNDFPPNLSKLTLSRTYLKDDPMATLEKLPNLRILVVSNHSFQGSEMVCSRNGFRKLESLSIRNLPLREWNVEKGALSSLRSLHIDFCISLRRIPDGLRYVITLKEIVLERMHRKFKESIERGGEDFYKVQHVPSLVCINFA